MEKKEMAVYPAIFETDNGGITIIFPDLPGAVSCAETENEAVFMAKDALGAWIAANEALGNDVPAPSRIADIPLGPNQSVCLVEAWLPIFREEQRAGSVKKNVTIPVWLNILAEKAGLNFSQVLQAGLKHTLGIQDRQ